MDTRFYALGGVMTDTARSSPPAAPKAPSDATQGWPSMLLSLGFTGMAARPCCK